MNLLQRKCEKPISTRCGCKYDGIAFDGCYFYLTCHDSCEIIKFDTCACEIESFKTIKPYSCICYDSTDCCFWAASNQCSYELYKLDLCFNEIDCLTIYPSDGCGATIVGLTYDCGKDRLVVAFLNCVIAVQKSDCDKCIVLQKSYAKCNKSILSISPSYIISTLQDHRQTVDIYDGCGKEIHSFAVPESYIIENIIFYPCVADCNGKFYFYALATKNNRYPYLVEWTIDCCHLEIDMELCNFVSCVKDCGEKPKSKPDFDQSCNDIIESIALAEAALAHILNAEGEKLQRIIADAEDLEYILCANDSVNETVVNVTHLEIILHDKLAVLKELCRSYKPNCNDCDCREDCGCDEDFS